MTEKAIKFLVIVDPNLNNFKQIGIGTYRHVNGHIFTIVNGVMTVSIPPQKSCGGKKYKFQYTTTA